MRATEKAGRLGRFAIALHGAALGVWLGALGMTGVVAGIAFPAMRELDPALPAYSAYEGEHWSIAAGKVMNGAFGALLMVQTVAAVVVIGTLAMAWAGRVVRGKRGIAHVVVCAALMALLGWQAATQRTLNARLETYWAAAEAGENARAAEMKASFDALHERAEGGMRATAMGLFVALVTMGVNAAGRRMDGEGGA